jgi:PAT family beta-lactamase induction signal transducer AmpG
MAGFFAVRMLRQGREGGFNPFGETPGDDDDDDDDDEDDGDDVEEAPELTEEDERKYSTAPKVDKASHWEYDAAVALEFKRMGMGAEALGTFAATIMLPWAWKWLFGPFVDNLHLERFGRRSQWIVAMQIGMILSLIAAMSVFPTVGPDGSVAGLALFTTLLLTHNLFGACQDVAIDALAVGSLSEEERGRANGFMFGAAQLGIALGGSGVIWLKGFVGFPFASLLVPACLLGIVTMMLRLTAEKALAGEVPRKPGEPVAGW